MRYRYLIAALLVVILAADLGWKAWSERPYVVTGYAALQNDVSVHYTLPAGGVGEIRVPAVVGQYCWGRVEIGKPLPDCIRSWTKVGETVPPPTPTPPPPPPVRRS